MASSSAEVSSVVLEELQTDLTQLSNTLNELYELMNADMSQVNEFWRDPKYEEFVQGYKPQIQKCEEIAMRYDEWCKKVLSPMIEKVKNIETADVSGDGGGGSGDGSGGGTATAPTTATPANSIGSKFNLGNKKEGFANGVQKLHDKGAAVEQAKMQKWNSEHSHKEGRDANEREYPHQGILDQQNAEEMKKLAAQQLWGQRQR